MKFCFIASNMDVSNGNGRFAHSLVSALQQEGHDALILIERGQRELMGARSVLYSRGILKKFILNPFIIAWHMRGHRIDVIHAFDAWPWGIWAYLAHLLLRVPFGMTIYATYGVYPLTRRFQGPLLRAAYHASVLNIAISHETARRIRARVPDASIIVINQGIFYKDYQHTTPHELITPHPYILSVAYMKRRKGYDVAVQVFAKLLKSFPRLRYVIRASGSSVSYEQRVRELATELGVADHIIWLPKLDENALMNVFRDAEVFFLPSISSDPVYFEGFGSVYLEAQACGTPVVTSRGGGQEDALIDGQTGYLMPEGDVDAGAELLGRILSDHSIRNKMSTAAARFALSMDWQIIAKRYTNTYQQKVTCHG